jgi:hypothetical protein
MTNNSFMVIDHHKKELNGIYKTDCIGYACYTDDDCDNESPFCLQGACVQCYMSQHCASSQICNIASNTCSSTNQCDKVENDCSLIGLPYCANTNHGKRCGNCLINKDCDQYGDGLICGFNNLCILKNSPDQCSIDSDCPENYVCSNNTCLKINAQCYDTTDCYNDYVCIDSQCQTIDDSVECEDNQDCEHGLICINQLCEFPSKLCMTNNDCSSDNICSNNICVPLSASCTSDNDCPLDLSCVKGNCQLNIQVINILRIGWPLLIIIIIIFIWAIYKVIK